MALVGFGLSYNSIFVPCVNVEVSFPIFRRSLPFQMHSFLTHEALVVYFTSSSKNEVSVLHMQDFPIVVSERGTSIDTYRTVVASTYFLFTVAKHTSAVAPSM